jgi:outer membrane protein OmpA-like peptidoglycan-associated protein
MEFSLKAWNPRPLVPSALGGGWNTFWYQLSFEYNGNDLRNLAIFPRVDKSAHITKSSFDTTWVGQPYSPVRAPVAEVMFQLTGRWDPWGRGNVSFNGELKIAADGKVSLSVKSEQNWVRVDRAPTSCTRVAPTLPHGPMVLPLPFPVTFAVNSDRVIEGEERRVTTFVNGLPPAIKASIARGDSPIRVEGFASTTGSLPYNRDLSRRRAERVVAILRDLLGSATKFEVIAHGKSLARTGDQVESPKERVAIITINYLAVPATDI